MKKLVTLMMVLCLMLSLTACGVKEEQRGEPSTHGEALLFAFEDLAKEGKDAQTIADTLCTNEVIPFMAMSMPVEEGFLSGFTTEITGFEQGVMFGPAIGSIPFVGYVFELADGADTAAFMQTLADNADLRWNICVEAEEAVYGAEGNMVFFVMCNKDLSAE